MKKIIGVMCVASCFMTYSNISATSVDLLSTQTEEVSQSTETTEFSAEEQKASLPTKAAAKVSIKAGELARRVFGFTKEKMATALQNAATVSNTKVVVGTQQTLGGEKPTNALILFTNMTSKEAFIKEVDNLSALNDKASAKVMKVIENRNTNPIERQNAITLYTFLKMMRAYLPTLAAFTKNIHDLLVTIVTSKKIDAKFITKINELAATLQQVIDPAQVISIGNAIAKIVLQNDIQMINAATKAEMEKTLLCFGERNTAILGRPSKGLSANAVNLHLAVKEVLETPVTAEDKYINIIRDGINLRHFACISVLINLTEAIIRFVLATTPENRRALEELVLTQD